MLRLVGVVLLVPLTAWADPQVLADRLEIGRKYRAAGQVDQERAIWNQFYDDYESGKIDKKSARGLMYVALAARYLGGYKDANDTFRDAVDADPKGKDGARANVEWAALFLEKYDAGHAEVCLDEALKVIPDDADAHALMAQVRMQQGDTRAAEKEIALALKANPKQTQAIDLRAEVALHDERYDDALALAKQSGDGLRARTIAAAAHWLRDQPKKYEAERDQVLAKNPRASQFFHGVAEFLVLQHRYLEANLLEEQAVKTHPKDYVALAALGSNFLRLGDDARGLEMLRRAWDGDPYNVRTYNLLNLFEQVIPKAYTLVEGKPFRLRLPTKERAILERYAKPMIAREFDELCKRYGFVPQGPLTMELYTDPSHYAVRTVGLPGLEALGVTFGQVVTAMSPSNGKFNWGQTLWHEVAHVFSIQLSKSRVPRWFTEGLAEWETARVRPEWSRHTHAELYQALQAGKLSSVVELNGAFSRARDVAHMVVTYHQSAEAVSFLIARFGFPVVLKALKLFGAGKDTREVIPQVTGLSVAQFDAAFAGDLRARLKAYEGTFFVRHSDYSDVDALREAIKKNPKDLRATGLYAIALVKAGRGDEAQKVIGKAKASGASEAEMKEVILAAANLALGLKDRKTAKESYAFLTRAHADGYDARYGLGEIAAADGDVAEAEKHFTLAKQMDPHKAEPYLELAKLYMKTREDDALRELEQAALLDCMMADPPKLLVEKHAAKQRWAKVVEAAQLALYVDPFDAAVHIRYARALAALGRQAEARGELAAAGDCDPDEAQRAEIKELLARVR